MNDFDELRAAHAAEVEALEARIDELLQEDQVALTSQHQRNRIARATNSLIMNLNALNGDTALFFQEFEQYSPQAQTAILRGLKQFKDLAVNQFKTFNLPI